MREKHLLFIALMLLISAVLFAQVENPAQDYWQDETGQFHQVIRWTRTNALYYDVEVEKRDNTGQWHTLESWRTENTYLELVLPPAAYRFRIHTYNVLEKLVGTSDWTGLSVYEAKVPAADKPSKVEIIQGSTSFTITISGRDLVEYAEVYLISRKKSSEQINPISLDYSFDESWIKVEFSSAAVSQGTYDLVITNPGGLDQTVEGVELKFVRAPVVPGTAGPFDLDNKKSDTFGLFFSGGINLESYDSYGEYRDGTNSFIYGVGITPSLGRFKEYGKFFLLPNVYFFELSFTGKNTYEEQFEYTEVFHKGADQWAFTLDFGALYKIRLGRSQRLLFNFGASVGLGLDRYYNASVVKEIGGPKWSGDGYSLYYYVAGRTGISYRFTPTLSGDFGVIVGGGDVLAYSEEFDKGSKPNMVNFTIGLSYWRVK